MTSSVAIAKSRASEWTLSMKVGATAEHFKRGGTEFVWNGKLGRSMLMASMPIGDWGVLCGRVDVRGREDGGGVALELGTYAERNLDGVLDDAKEKRCIIRQVVRKECPRVPCKIGFDFVEMPAPESAQVGPGWRLMEPVGSARLHRVEGVLSY